MIRLVDVTGAVVRAAAEPDQDDPVFAGHYPGFPILPGLYLVEYVQEMVCAVRGNPALRPVALERVKFLRPVYQGDKLAIEAKLEADGEQFRCEATVRTRGEPVAEIRLRYPGGVS